jgi:hypothetical protein
VCDKLLKILIPPENALSSKNKMLAFYLGRCCLFLVLIPYTGEFVRKYSSSLTGKFIKKMYIGMEKVKSVTV